MLRLTLQNINTTPKNTKQSGIVAVDSRFAIIVARRYGVTTRENSAEKNNESMSSYPVVCRPAVSVVVVVVLFCCFNQYQYLALIRSSYTHS